MITVFHAVMFLGLLLVAVGLVLLHYKRQREALKRAHDSRASKPRESFYRCPTTHIYKTSRLHKVTLDLPSQNHSLFQNTEDNDTDDSSHPKDFSSSSPPSKEFTFWMKCEFEQPTRSFHVRGVTEIIGNILDNSNPRNLSSCEIWTSFAAAHVGQLFGVPITCVLPESFREDYRLPDSTYHGLNDDSKLAENEEEDVPHNFEVNEVETKIDEPTFRSEDKLTDEIQEENESEDTFSDTTSSTPTMTFSDSFHGGNAEAMETFRKIRTQVWKNRIIDSMTNDCGAKVQFRQTSVEPETRRYHTWNDLQTLKHESYLNILRSGHVKIELIAKGYASLAREISTQITGMDCLVLPCFDDGSLLCGVALGLLQCALITDVSLVVVESETNALFASYLSRKKECESETVRDRSESEPLVYGEHVVDSFELQWRDARLCDRAMEWVDWYEKKQNPIQSIVVSKKDLEVTRAVIGRQWGNACELAKSVDEQLLSFAAICSNRMFFDRFDQVVAVV